MDAREDALVVAWMTIDDKLHGHRKIMKLGPDKVAAAGLWVLCGSWSADHLTDGWVPAYVVEQWDPDLKLAARLVDVRLWHEDVVDGDEGYRFHDWCEINRSKEEIERSRADSRDRQRRSRDRRRQPDGTFGPEPGPGGGQIAIDEPPDQGSYVTDGDVTRDSHSSYASVTPLPNPPPTISTQKTWSRAAPADHDPDLFARFWAAYPRKIKKQDAAKAWRQVLRQKVEPEKIITAASQQAARWRAEGKEIRFIPYPASWLRGGAYDDEPEPARLTLVAADRAPELTYADLYDRADAMTVAKLIRSVWVDPPRKSSDPDPTPYPIWVRARRREFIEANRDKLHAALAVRRTG